MPKIPADIRSLCRAHTDACVQKLAGFVNAVEGVPPAVQVQAAQILLDRGWGKPKTPIGGGEDGDDAILVQIIEKVREPK